MNTLTKAVVLGLGLTLAACGDKSGFKSGVNSQTSKTNSNNSPNSGLDGAGAGGKPGSGNDSGVAGFVGAVTDNYGVQLKVDVVFIVDTSASMNEEIAATQANLGKLVTTLNNARLDSRIHLILERPFALPAGSDSKKIAFVQQRVGSNDAITQLNAFFAGTLNALYRDAAGATVPAIPLRKDGKLEVIAISDDNGVGMGNLAADFDRNKSLKATFNSIVGLPTSAANAACDIASVGTEYMTLSMQSGGSILDLCSTDWSSLIGRLSNDIVKRSVTFTLTKNPNPASIQVGLDGQKMSPSDYTYDAAKNAITLTKTDAVKDGSKLIINYNGK